MKKSNKKSFGLIAFLSLVIAAVCSLTSCSDDLDVQQSYPFTVKVMPCADKIAQGQTVELRFESSRRAITPTPSIQSDIPV